MEETMIRVLRIAAKTACLAMFLLAADVIAIPQTIAGVTATPPATANSLWLIDISFSQAVEKKRIKHLFLAKTDEPGVIELQNIRSTGSSTMGPNLYEA